jgi:hypothetical protein
MASLAGIERCAGVHVVGAGILSACCEVEGREPQYSWQAPAMRSTKQIRENMPQRLTYLDVRESRVWMGMGRVDVDVL